MHTLSRTSFAFVLVAPLVSCVTAPVAPIPDPLPEILEWARPERTGEGAFLGLEVRENDSGSLEALSFAAGVKVTDVADGSPAAAAGFRTGDVLLAWDDVPVDAPATLRALLDDPPADLACELEAQRGDSVFRVSVQLRAREGPATEEPELRWVADPVRSRAGWITGRGGVVLVTTDPEGPFPTAGIAVGSVVTALDGRPVRSERGWIRRLAAREPGDRVEVEFRSPGGGPKESAQVRLYEPSTRVTEITVPIVAGYIASPDGEEASFYLVDLWIISLFRYRRAGSERHYRFLRFFTFSTGVGELVESQ